MPLIWRLQFHKIFLTSNNGIVFGQDNGMLTHTKFGANTCDMLVFGYVICDMWVCGYVIRGMLICWYVVCVMLVCGMLMLICWYGDRY
jgi:hypothetical protein